MTSFFESYRAVRREKKLGIPSDVGPMRLRAGAMVELDRGIVLMRRSGVVKSPGRENLVTHVGTWRTGTQCVSSFYLTSAGADANERTVLQAYQDKVGGSSNYLLLRPVTTVIPASAEEWDVWLRKGSGLLGEPGIIVPPDNLEYTRAVQRSDEWIEPESYTEQRSESATEASKIYHHQSMLFARRVGYNVSIEYLQQAKEALAHALELDPNTEVQDLFASLAKIIAGATPPTEYPEELLLADFVNPEETTTDDGPRIEIWAGFEIDSTAFKVN
jgi:hypothetical protein